MTGLVHLALSDFRSYADLALPVDAPLIALASRYARVGMRRRSPVASVENQAHLDLMNTLRVLAGRTIMLELVRR